MITKRTIERVAELYFEYGLSVLRIAIESNNLTIGNVTHCLKEMEYRYHPIIINEKIKYNHQITPERLSRNKRIFSLFELGYNYSDLSRRFGLSPDRIRQIILRGIRGRHIHARTEYPTAIRNQEKIIDEPNLCEEYLKVHTKNIQFKQVKKKRIVIGDVITITEDNFDLVFENIHSIIKNYYRFTIITKYKDEADSFTYNMVELYNGVDTKIEGDKRYINIHIFSNITHIFTYGDTFILQKKGRYYFTIESENYKVVIMP